MSTQTKTPSDATPGLTWEEICRDSRFQDLPYKIETNARGQIVMSPTYLYHSALQAEIAGLLREKKAGRAVTEPTISTGEGKKVADVGWFSQERWERVKDAFAAPVAPEVTVEILSDGNSDDEVTHKRSLYFEAGAKEVWLCDKDGAVRFFDANGERDASALVPTFPTQVDT